MFVRAKKRFKYGKEHRYWSVVENCRNPNRRVVQRQVLYLGEINDSQRATWRRSIEVLCVNRTRMRSTAHEAAGGFVSELPNQYTEIHSFPRTTAGLMLDGEAGRHRIRRLDSPAHERSTHR